MIVATARTRNTIVLARRRAMRVSRDIGLRTLISVTGGVRREVSFGLYMSLAGAVLNSCLSKHIAV